MAKNFHEQFDRPPEELPPDRSTGLVFAAVALIIAYLWRKEPNLSYSAVAIAALLAIVSFVSPIVLRPLNILWMKFAHLLNRIMNPVITGLLFALVIVPAGLIMQLWHDPLQKRHKRSGSTYWRERKKLDPPSSMTNQF